MKYYIISSVVCLVVSLFTNINESHIKFLSKPKVVKQKTIIINDNTPFSPKALKKALELYGIRNSDIVYRQAILETGNFTSNIFLENNNLFGMKHPYIRRTTSLGRKRGHAKYSNWLDSVRDMKYFQEFYRPRIYGMHKGDYYSFLNDVYATDQYYTIKLKQIDV